jgi:mRNA interferase RelE/StbE
MASTVEFLPVAATELGKLDRRMAARLLHFLDPRDRRADDPRPFGEPLRGARLAAYWKYRVGDDRPICSSQDPRIVVTVVRIGHRSDVYRD